MIRGSEQRRFLPVQSRLWHSSALFHISEFLVFEITKMWRAGVDTKVNAGGGDDDDWETDPDFVVSVIIQLMCVHFLCRFRINLTFKVHLS